MGLIDWALTQFLKDDDGMTVMQYLKTEIKPDLETLRKDHQRLSEKVAALPTRYDVRDLRLEFDGKVDKLHKRIDTKQDKQLV